MRTTTHLIISGLAPPRAGLNYQSKPLLLLTKNVFTPYLPAYSFLFLFLLPPFPQHLFPFHTSSLFPNNDNHLTVSNHLLSDRSQDVLSLMVLCGFRFPSKSGCPRSVSSEDAPHLTHLLKVEKHRGKIYLASQARCLYPNHSKPPHSHHRIAIRLLGRSQHRLKARQCQNDSSVARALPIFAISDSPAVAPHTSRVAENRQQQIRYLAAA